MVEIAYDIFKNSTLIAGVVSWVVAQLIKFFLCIFIERKVDLTRLTSSGGMPSGHSAVVSAVAFGVGRRQGFSSTEFALAAVFALIVMYDAAGVRQAVGIQAQILNDVLHDIYRGSGFAPKKVREILGHTPTEVIAGSFLGLIIAMLII